MTTTDTGRLGEKAAAKFLRKNRYKIADMNVHSSHNEIDIIATNKEYIVFVEVKTRHTEPSLQSFFGSPAAAVNYSKQKRTIEAARHILSSGKYTGLQPRFDVIEIYLDKTSNKVLNINHILNAFGA